MENSSNKSDLQDVERSRKNERNYDPFAERRVPNPTTDGETLTHILKAAFGTGILAMPVAFKDAGLIGGIFLTLFVAFVCTHCAYILVKCAHVLYYKTRRSEMSFPEVAEAAFTTGPQWARCYAKPTKYLIQIGLFVTYYGVCGAYSVIVAANFKQIIDHYTDYPDGVDIRIVILMLLLPLILLCWIPNLKYLAPVSMVANIFMGAGVAITLYYLIRDMDVTAVKEIPIWPELQGLASAFCVTVFAMEAIGVIMPLENNMKTPQNFVGICGVLNKGMTGVTMVYVLLGFLGYGKYGRDTCDSITLNLPKTEYPAQAVKILIALAVYCTFGLYFYVCLDIAWNAIKDNYPKRPLLANYVLRTFLVTAIVMLAVAVPTIGPFIGLIGAFCFSILGLMVPVFIETVTFWDRGFGIFNWIAVKNIIICVIGLLALVFGSTSAIKDILALYTSNGVTKKGQCM